MTHVESALAGLITLVDKGDYLKPDGTFDTVTQERGVVCHTT
jgi:hypothetical protein